MHKSSNVPLFLGYSEFLLLYACSVNVPAIKTFNEQWIDPDPHCHTTRVPRGNNICTGTTPPFVLHLPLNLFKCSTDMHHQPFSNIYLSSFICFSCAFSSFLDLFSLFFFASSFLCFSLHGSPYLTNSVLSLSSCPVFVCPSFSGEHHHQPQVVSKTTVAKLSWYSMGCCISFKFPVYYDCSNSLL